MRVSWSALRRRADAVREALASGGPALSIRMAGFALLVPVLLRQPLERQARALRRRRPIGRSDEGIVATADAVIAALRPVVRPGCLTRGLLVCRFLGGPGRHPVLVFGLGRERTAPFGHCWIEIDGTPVAEPRDPYGDYVPTVLMDPAVPAVSEAR